MLQNNELKIRKHEPDIVQIRGIAKHPLTEQVELVPHDNSAIHEPRLSIPVS